MKLRHCLALAIWAAWPLSMAGAQGLIPPRNEQPDQGQASKPLLIDDKVPESLQVIDINGNVRTLLSYKSPIEVMVVVALNPGCATAGPLWPEFRRFYASYKHWHVSFIALGASENAQIELTKLLKKERLRWPVLRDQEGRVGTVLQISGTPEVILIDESGALKYRGPLRQGWSALETVIGHTESVRPAEPPLKGACVF